MQSVVVVGQGFVGGALTQVLIENGVSVYACDVAGQFKPGVKLGSTNLTELITCSASMDKTFRGICFICVPTPMSKDGSANTVIVEHVLTHLATITSAFKTKIPKLIAVIKSTVPPGSVKRWNQKFNDAGLSVVFNPEFLREASALDDMRYQKRIILGGPRRTVNIVKQFYERIFPSVPIIKTSSTSAEMVKYVTNVHLAVKVLLANEFYQVCQALDETGEEVDYDKVIEYATQDERLGKSHWKVPGPMALDDGSDAPAFGIGGSCFVKDLNALIHLAKTIGVKPTVMEAAWQKNLEIRPQRDWEKLKGRAITGD